MRPTPSAPHGPPLRPPSGRSIGRFLCVHPTTLPYEDIDDLPLLDVKQDAALRALIALRDLGKSVGADPVAAFDAEPRLAELALRWAHTDAIRKHLGRGTRPIGTMPTRPRRPRTLSLDALIAAWLSEALTAPLPEPSDPDQLDQLDRLEAAEDDPTEDLRTLWTHGIPGLELKHMRRAIALMGAIQHLKDQGATPLPDPARQRLRRLRKTTGLPLRVDLL